MQMSQLRRRTVGLIADRSILTKLIVSLFLIATPLYMLNYVVTNIGADRNRLEIERALTSSLTSYKNIIDGELQRIQQMLKLNALEIAIMHLDLMEPDVDYVDKMRFVARVEPYLNRIFTSSRFMSNIEIHLPILGLTHSAISGTGKLDAAAYQAMRVQGKPFVEWNNGIYMNVPYLPKLPNYDGMFVISVQISESTLSSYLSKIVNYKNSGAFLFALHDKWSVASDTPDPLGMAIRVRLVERYDLSPALSGPRIVHERIGGERYIIVYDSSKSTNMLLVAYAPESEVFDSLSIFKKYFYSFSALSALVIILLAIGLYKLIHKPLRTLMHAFRRVELGQLKFSLQHRNEDEFGYLYRRFNTMTEKLDNMVNVVYEQKLLGQRSELKRLQAQINPHFLYNNFFILKRLIRLGNRDKAMQFAEYLGRYFQFVTRNASDEITLEHDVLHAQTYVDIQSICFDQRVAVFFQPPPEEIKHHVVPRLILQPVLENCFNHVFERQLSQGELSVSFSFDEQYIHIDVEDNGKHMDDRQLEHLTTKLAQADRSTEESTGMINVHRRLRLMFGEQSGLVLSRSELGGLRTTIVIERKDVATDAEAVDR